MCGRHDESVHVISDKRMDFLAIIIVLVASSLVFFFFGRTERFLELSRIDREEGRAYSNDTKKGSMWKNQQLGGKFVSIIKKIVFDFEL